MTLVLLLGSGQRCKVEVLVLVTEHENDLYELTSKGHAIYLEWLN